MLVSKVRVGGGLTISTNQENLKHDGKNEQWNSLPELASIRGHVSEGARLEQLPEST